MTGALPRGFQLPGPVAQHYVGFELPPWQGLIECDWSGVLAPAGDRDWWELVRRLGEAEPVGRHDRMRRMSLTQPGSPKEVWIKTYTGSTLAQRLAMLICRDKATKAWNNAWRLVKHGITTPRPIAALITPWWRRRHPRWLVFEDFAAAQTFGDCYASVVASRHDMGKLLAAAAVFIGRLHQLGLWHRDLNSSNLLVRIAGIGEFEFCLVDVNRMRHSQRMNQYKRIHDLCRLGIARSEYVVLLDAYTASTGVEIDRHELSRALDHSQQLHQARKTRSYKRYWLKITYQLGKIRNFAG